MKADLIIAAFGFNESFSGIEKIPDFKIRLQAYLSTLKAAAYNGDSAPQIVMVSPIANENVEGVDAGAMNNKRLLAYTSALRDICAKEEVGFIDCYTPISKSMESSQRKLTINGCHLNEFGYQQLAKILFEGLTGHSPPALNQDVRAAVIEKNTQHFYRYRPLNTFYYTGGGEESMGTWIFYLR